VAPEIYIFMIRKRWIILFVLALIQAFSAQSSFADQTSASSPAQITRLTITRNLTVGSRGDDVKVLQTLLLNDGVYPEGSITGYFGRLTKQAVIRFQEKYADEILKPNGLDHGTGVVGSSTRAKLNTQHESSLSRCLPPGIKLDDIVSTKIVRYIPKNIVRTTVEQALGELNAACKNDKLIDASGREIYFYHLTGCWGNPPKNYHEIFQKQLEEIATLKQQYTVVEMTCNPSGMPII
jgi:hypothetical protein